MKPEQFIACIEAIAPRDSAATWDNSGLQVAGTYEDVRVVAVALDPTPETVEKALVLGAHMLVTHHPLYLQPMPLANSGCFLTTARMLLASGCWHYAAHTSLDSRPEGPAGWLARALQLQQPVTIDPFCPGPAHFPQTGFGLVGRLPHALAYDAFCGLLKKHLQRDFWVTSGAFPETVSQVGYCTGSGASYMNKAKSLGADVFITGDVKYHQALESGQFTIDVGHFSLEERMTEELAGLLNQTVADEAVEIHFIAGREPFSLYLPGESAF